MVAHMVVYVSLIKKIRENLLFFYSLAPVDVFDMTALKVFTLNPNWWKFAYEFRFY